MSYKDEIIEFLNAEAIKVVKGSEFGPDEHFFGIAAEMLANSIPVEKVEGLIKDFKSQHRAENIFDVEVEYKGKLAGFVRNLKALLPTQPEKDKD